MTEKNSPAYGEAGSLKHSFRITFRGKVIDDKKRSSQIAKAMGCHRSKISRLLKKDVNHTLDSVQDITDAAGYKAILVLLPKTNNLENTETCNTCTIKLGFCKLGVCMNKN